MHRIGVVGLGNHFIEHILPALKLRHDVTITIICDIDEDKISHALKYHPNAKTTTIWQSVFDEPIDIIFCISFPQLHEGIIEEAIRRQIPVFVEKPPFVSGNAIPRLVSLKRDQGYRCAVGVGINFNFSAMAEIVQTLVKNEEYGKVAEVDICHLSNKPDNDIWKLNNPLRTMMLAQAIHPLSLMKLFSDYLSADGMTHSVTHVNGRYLVKMLLPIFQGERVINGSVRTGNLGPRFIFRMSITFDSGTRFECTPETIAIYSTNQRAQAGTSKWATIWEAKPFMHGIEKGGYAQEIAAFLDAVQNGIHDGQYSPDYFGDVYSIIDMVVHNAEA